MRLLQNSASAWLSHLVLLSLAFVAPASARSVVDATGRTVEIPDQIERVMPAGQPAAVLLYTLAPEKMVGWPHTPGPKAKRLIDPHFSGLPELLPLVREGKVQSERIQAARPDVILDYGSTSPRYVERATMVREATGIPVLLLDGKLERTPEIYGLLGAILGAEERAGDLAGAAERLLAVTRQKAEGRRRAAPIRVYYARSADGLTTAISSSILADVFRLVDVANVADGAGTGELSHVTRDQVYAWNPDAVVTSNPEFWKGRVGPEWAGLPAIAQGRVYLAPSLPFGWIDEPPSINRLLGLLWAGHVLYPAVYPDDLSPETRNFYQRFYRVELDDQQFKALSR
jgi:iron complex transport system substrate-binding protein